MGQLIEVLSARKDKKRLSELWSREDFNYLDHDTATIMAIMTDSTEILDKLDNYETEEGECDMCLAMDELRQDWKEEGRAEGREEQKRIQELIERIVRAGRQDQLTKLSEAGSLEEMYLEYGV